MKKQLLILAMAGAMAMFGANAALATCNISPLNGDAQCVDFNIHGASAEYDFFNAVAPGFLETEFGCSSAKMLGPAGALGNTSKYGVTVGSECTVNGKKTTIVFRYSSKASWDGIAGITGENEILAGYTNQTGDEDACVVAGDGFDVRTYADENQCNWGTGVCGDGTNGVTPSGNPVGTLCAHAMVGASDVAADELIENSTGSLKGPNGSYVVFRNFTTSHGVNTTQGATNGTGKTIQWPLANNYGDELLVVPFSFYANNSVTASTCVGGAMAGSPCASASDCDDPNAYKGGANNGTCTSAQISNMTREMAVQIFAGVVDNWADFGTGYVNLPIQVCFRHAGSGSHATLDWTVMHGAGQLMGTLATAQGSTNGPGINPAGYMWFNDGTGDALNCANYQASNWGAVTYADSDYTTVQAGRFNKTYANVHELTYQGQPGSHAALVGGSYDFYTTEHLFTTSHSLSYSDSQTPPQNYAINMYAQLKNYLASPSSLPSDEAYFWALPTQMTWYYGPAATPPLQELYQTYPFLSQDPTEPNY